MRTAELLRETKETKIKARLSIDSENRGLHGNTGIGFFDHMLNSFCIHGGFSLDLEVKGDLEVDCHHTIEDTGIVLGKLFSEIAGDRKKIARFGSAYIPMDESLAFCAVDVGGRGYLVYDVPVTSPMIGNYDTQITREFFYALAMNMAATLHLKIMYGENDHHKVEAIYKACARALSAALAETENAVLSAKGTLI